MQLLPRRGSASAALRAFELEKAALRNPDLLAIMAAEHPDDGQHPLLLLKVSNRPIMSPFSLNDHKSLRFGVKHRSSPYLRSTSSNIAVIILTGGHNYPLLTSPFR
jgi:hypothetical protein